MENGLKTFPPKLDTLPSPQRKLFPVLEPVSRAGFVLYGRTAVALRYGHRSSEDFDFFSSEPLDKESLFELVPPLKRAFVIQEDLPTTLVLQTRDGVKISFFGEIGFGRLGEPELTSTAALLVASPLDLLAAKLKVILQRANAKDYLESPSFWKKENFDWRKVWLAFERSSGKPRRSWKSCAPSRSSRTATSLVFPSP